MHSAVLQNKKYLEFANENTVEVLALQRLPEAVQKKDVRAVAYKAKGADGKEELFMLHWPGLTLADIEGMNSTKAGSFNKSGKIPYVSIVDPWTEKEIKGYNGGSAKGIQTDVDEASKVLAKEHGKGVTRKELNKVKDAAVKSAAFAGQKEFSKALEVLAKATPSSKEAPAALTDRLAEAKKVVLDAAETALNEIESANDKAQAKKDLLGLMDRLRGTGFEARAKELLPKL
jgi:hypothetical protein